MILVMSGTKDGRDLIQALSTLPCDIIATTTTEYGGSLIEQSDTLRVIDHPLNIEALVETIQQNDIKILVDATHPYATNASENAMTAAGDTDIEYVRYEREDLPIKNGQWFSSYDAIIEYLNSKTGNVLLTIGANNLEIFAQHMEKERLFARILPMSKIIAKCESYGLSPKNIIGVQGPFTATYNEAMIDAYDIKFMVSKATAKTGGFDQKIMAAESKGIELLILERPRIEYTTAFSSIEEVADHVENFLKHIDRVT